MLYITLLIFIFTKRLTGHLMQKPIFVCYIPGLDLRHVTPDNMPNVFGFLGSFPSAKLKSYPCSELLPAILTGTYPCDHGKYQVSLKKDFSHGADKQLIDYFPDVLTTASQCFFSLFNRQIELPGIPPRRRRMLDLGTRFKFYSRSRSNNILMDINGLETIFSIVGLGKGQSSYKFTMEFKKLDKMISSICQREYLFELLEIHSLDILQLWYADQHDKVSACYRHMDDFLVKLKKQCEDTDTTLVILSDRAVESITDSINIRKLLEDLPITESDYSYFIEPPMARFWFWNDRARQLVTGALRNTPKGSLISYKDMKEHNLELNDDRYGEIFFVADSGTIIFPHDFYNPIGNLFLGLSDWKQRPRLKSPIQRAVHGYLPYNKGETGIIIVCNDNYQANVEEASIIDVAPSLLELVNARIPDQMRGTEIFSIL